MRLFELQNNIPIITVEALMIPEFKKLADKGDRGFSELQYVYFASDYKSIYLSYEEDLREERLRDDFIGDKKWKPSKEVLDACKRYREFQYTPTMRFLDANIKAMQAIEKLFNTVDLTAIDERGKPVHDVTKITNAVKNAGGIIDNIDKLKDKVRKELSATGTKQRGGSTGGLLEFDED